MVSDLNMGRQDSGGGRLAGPNRQHRSAYTCFVRYMKEEGGVEGDGGEGLSSRPVVRDWFA